jgi:hypothetical protein
MAQHRLCSLIITIVPDWELKLKDAAADYSDASARCALREFDAKWLDHRPGTLLLYGNGLVRLCAGPPDGGSVALKVISRGTL